jgi:hypothetical protein
LRLGDLDYLLSGSDSEVGVSRIIAFGFVKTDIPNAYNLSRVRHLNAGDIWRIISDEVADKSTFLQLITLRDVVI